MKIVIKNSTLWPTSALRRFVVRIANEEFPGTKPSNTRRVVTVYIGYNRSGKKSNSCSGHAPLNSSYATVNVPFPHKGKTFPVLDFCHVVGHEFGHCRGLSHADMGWHYGGSCKRGSYTNPHYEWAKALPVPEVRVKAKPTTDEKRTKALDAARAAVDRWTRKRKLADTKLKIWSRKVRRLERLLSADTAHEEPIAACGPIESAD